MTRTACDVAVPLERELMRNEILAGLQEQPKRIAPKYFYDATGSRLFDAICRTPEYYVTRTEKALLGAVAEDLARLVGRDCILVEPGSGTAEKVELLLEALRPAAYVPVEICAEALTAAVTRIGVRHPWLRIEPRCADFGAHAMEGLPRGRRLVFFPGSTIGNFEPPDAVRFLQRLGRLAGSQGNLLIGVDLKKEAGVLNEAYNDAAGITAAFNLNVLARLNRELAADFDLAAFEHRARYLPALGRVEMHLVSRKAQQVTVAGQRFPFRPGESIHTENSYKYTIDEFRHLAAEAGWEPLAAWADPGHLFSIQYFARAWAG